MSEYKTFCPTTRDYFTLEPGPSAEDYAAMEWTFVCPSCGEQHLMRVRPRPTSDPGKKHRSIDIPLDLDLGELIPSQHVVVMGIELKKSESLGSILHYDFVPGFDPDNRRLNTSWGLGDVTDDVGTHYEHRGEGGWGPDADDLVHWGDERLGNTIPSDATSLTVEVHHAGSWVPPGTWIRSFTVDLRKGLIRAFTEG